jgi:phage terminase small subunit
MRFKKDDIILVELKCNEYEYTLQFLEEFKKHDGVFTVLKDDDDDIYVYSEYNGCWCLSRGKHVFSLYGLPEVLFRI